MFEESNTQELIVVESEPSQALGIPIQHGQFVPTLDQMVAAWLDAKGRRTKGNYNTRYRYELFMTDFRLLLQSAGLDIDADPGVIATVAQNWASRPILAPEVPLYPSHHHAMGRASAKSRAERLAAEGGVSAGTYNGRVTCLSSFYVYATKRGWITRNPISIVERNNVRERDFAYPLEKEEVEQRLAAIDRSELIGRRDYALLTLALTTGRRAAELTALVWGDIRFSLAGKTTIYWRYCKGGKSMEDDLVPGVRDAILDYMHARYGKDLDTIPPDTPLWLVHARNGYAGHRLLQGGLSGIWQRRLGTTKVHASRHTFAYIMEQTGAPISDISHRLGHSNIATTSIYLQRMHRAENPYAEKIEQAIGITGREGNTHSRLQDKAERVKQALLAYPDGSNSELARIAGVDRTTVRMYRRKLGDVRQDKTELSSFSEEGSD